MKLVYAKILRYTFFNSQLNTYQRLALPGIDV